MLVFFLTSITHSFAFVFLIRPQKMIVHIVFLTQIHLIFAVWTFASVLLRRRSVAATNVPNSYLELSIPCSIPCSRVHFPSHHITSHIYRQRRVDVSVNHAVGISRNRQTRRSQHGESKNLVAKLYNEENRKRSLNTLN